MFLKITRLFLVLAFLLATVTQFANAASPQAPLAQVNHETCRPDGMLKTAGVNTPYCLMYDTNGREIMPSDRPRRIIGYFTSWRHGKNGQPAYLVKDIPWANVTHINYAFAHVDSQNRVSVGTPGTTNPAIGMTWPGVAGAEMDPAFSYNGHFNLLSKFKKQYPNVKTLISIGGWAETGGFFDDSTTSRTNSGGFYTMTTNADNTVNTAGINTFADSVVAFLRQYNFNGADIDYEYATSMPDAGYPDDLTFSNPRRAGLVAGYVALMKTLREKLDAASVQDGKYYLLSVAAPASGYMLRGMETYQVTQYLDYLNMMSYDLHGTWNSFVGPNAALFDDGKDTEQIHWNVYGEPLFGGAGYLNTDWAYRYFRNAMQAGRINIGLPYYTRGWKNVNGGTNGLWGSSPVAGCTVVANQPACLGDGGVGIDNVWHDLGSKGEELGSGSNPMWHAKNLEQEIIPSYLSGYGLTPATDPTDQLTGTYTRFYDPTLVAPWLWNAQKKVFISTEDETSVQAKAQYVINQGIGGVMFWELAGDYAWYPNRANGQGGQGEYYIGSTLTTLLYNQFKLAAPYGNTRAKRAMPTQELNVSVATVSYPVGLANYPISPTLRITNNSTTTIPGGAQIQYNYSVSAPPNMTNWSGWGLSIASEHTGPNIGGFNGDMHLVTLTLPTYLSIAPGASADLTIVYYMPTSTFSNVTITFGGQTYSIPQNYLRGGGGGGITPTPTVGASPTRTNTPGGATATATKTSTSTATNTLAGPTATKTNTATATNTPAGPTLTHTRTPTAGPVGATVEAENYTARSSNAVGAVSGTDGTAATVLAARPNEWTSYSNQNLASASINLRYSNAYAATTLEVRAGTSTGTLLGTCNLPLTGGWTTYVTSTCALSGAGASGQTLVLVFKDTNYAYINWFSLDGGGPAPTATSTPTVVVLTATRTSTPTTAVLTATRTSTPTAPALTATRTNTPAAPALTATPTATQAASSTVEAEAYSARSSTAIGTYSSTDNGQPATVLGARPNEWTSYNNQNLSRTSINLRYSNAYAAATLEIRAGTSTGTLLGTCNLPLTASWSTYSTVTCALSGAGASGQTLVLVFTANNYSYINWFSLQ